ncbi:MAG TPA: kynureninase [Geminicoccaceae bacterium]|nr:kynureninase [Geminicoccaceae bacterium]
MTALPSRAALAALDAEDPLAPWRGRFALPDGIIYLDGNSLGPPPAATAAAIDDLVRRQWGEHLITSWTRHGWVDLPRTVGGKIARLVGAGPDEVLVADSISVNLVKLVAAALQLRPGRTVVVSERCTFPTDLYVVQGLRDLLGDRLELRLVDGDALAAALDERTALLLLSHVDYRSGRVHDMAGLTAAAHAAGALVLWDLAHSAGVMPLALARDGVDLAVGCGYKYLNGGPGAPAFLFVAERWQEQARQPLCGWFGHRQPFAFEPLYQPAAGIDRFQAGTPPILSLKALEVGVDLLGEVDLAALRAKSRRLGDCFIRLVEQRCAGFGLALASPRESERRGAQVAFRHAHGYPIVQALIARGVVGDFRAPDLLRFGLAPLYLRFVDLWDAVEILRRVLQERAWDRPKFKQRASVT